MGLVCGIDPNSNPHFQSEENTENRIFDPDVLKRDTGNKTETN
jgi:hypothetical protein